MKASQLLYPLIFIFAIFFVYTNFKNNLKYKKENIKPLFYLNEDDKTRHLISKILIYFIIALTGFLIIGLISSKTFTLESFFTMVLLPALMVFLYIPLTKKTMISNLGIYKRNALIRWEDIKSINYFKPNEKNQLKVKIIYVFVGRDASIDITFNKDDEQFDAFKETAKEYRNSKKKEKKSGN